MELQKALLLVAACYTDPEIERLYEAGDKLSRHQTKHDIDHACQVRDLAHKISSEISATRPNFLDDWTAKVVIPLAAYLHDIGRAIDVDEHANAGAKWTKKYLSRLRLPNDTETLPVPVINRIARIVACHRSSIVLNSAFNDPAWAIVVLADKCVGDEERVRPVRAAILSMLTLVRATWFPLRKGGIHDRANFAIKKSELDISGAEIGLALTVDTRVCDPYLIYTLYADRFQGSVKAAEYLGYQFTLVFNGQRFSNVGGIWQGA